LDSCAEAHCWWGRSAYLARAGLKHQFAPGNPCHYRTHYLLTYLLIVWNAQEQEPLTANMLSSVSVQEQKQMLGERLFPLIQAMHRDLAGKITGMLLEIDNSELIHMLESGESLRAKVNITVIC